MAEMNLPESTASGGFTRSAPTPDRSDDYLRRIQHAAEHYEEFEDLERFVRQANPQLPHQEEAQMSIFEFPLRDSSSSANEVPPIQGAAALREYLDVATPSNSLHWSRLILVENIDPQTVLLLGGLYDIKPCFFADHLRSSGWYRSRKPSDNMPTLPSYQVETNFLMFRFVATRDCQPKVQIGQSPHHLVDHLEPLRKNASILNQHVRLDAHRGPLEFSPVLYRRQSIAVYLTRQDERSG